MKQRVILMLALLCVVAQGVWAQTFTIVNSEEELYAAIEWPAQEIRLDADIQLNNYLNINGVTVTIDLNGHKLSRNLSEHGSEGHVIWVHGGSNLTLISSVAGGSIEGGMANNGGAIHIPFGNTVSATNVIFQNNSASVHHLRRGNRVEHQPCQWQRQQRNAQHLQREESLQRHPHRPHALQGRIVEHAVSAV